MYGSGSGVQRRGVANKFYNKKCTNQKVLLEMHANWAVRHFSCSLICVARTHTQTHTRTHTYILLVRYIHGSWQFSISNQHCSWLGACAACHHTHSRAASRSKTAVHGGQLAWKFVQNCMPLLRNRHGNMQINAFSELHIICILKSQVFNFLSININRH